MKKSFSQKHYMPNFLLHLFLPVVIPGTYGLCLLVLFLSFVSEPYAWPRQLMAVLFSLISALFVLLWLIAYTVAMRVSSYLVIQENNLLLKKGGKSLTEFNLDLFSHFLIKMTESLEFDGNPMEIELLAIDEHGYRTQLFRNDTGNGLVESWQEFAAKLEKTTDKAFRMEHYTIDTDGRKYRTEDYRKIRWRKRIPLFRNLFK